MGRRGRFRSRRGRAILRHNKLLFAPLDEIQKAHDEVRERYDYEVQKAAGGDLGLDDPPPPLTAATIRERFGKAADKLAEKTGNYYLGEDGKLLAILVRTPVEPAHRLHHPQRGAQHLGRPLPRALG